MSIYLSVEPQDIKIGSLILNLFFNCAIKINLSENPDFKPDLKHNLLLILDEFPATGNIPYVKKAAGYIAGYKLQLLTIFQNVSQLNKIYGIHKDAKPCLLIILAKLSLLLTNKMMLNIFQMK